MLPKRYRLHNSRDIKNVLQENKAFREDGLFLKLKQRNTERARFAVVVSSKVAKRATQRNRLKRLVRAALIPYTNLSKIGWDVVLVALPGLEAENLTEMRQIVTKLLYKTPLVSS